MSSKWQSDIERVYGLNSIGVAPNSPSQSDRGQTPVEEEFAIQLETAQKHIAALFQNLRRALDRPISDIAIKLGTTSDVIQSLETGRFDALPPWHETVRIVTAYTNLVNIDPGPALHVLQNSIPERREPAKLLDATIRPHIPYQEPLVEGFVNQPPIHQMPQSFDQFSSGGFPASGGEIVSNPIPAASLANVPSKTEPPVKWRKGLSGSPIPAGQATGHRLAYDESEGPQAFSAVISARISQMVRALTGGLDREAISGLVPGAGASSSMMKAVIGLVMIALALLTVLYSPLTARYAHAYLPSPLAHMVLNVHNFLSPPKISQHDGMKWIEASDPRARRADKLLISNK